RGGVTDVAGDQCLQSDLRFHDDVIDVQPLGPIEASFTREMSWKPGKRLRRRGYENLSRLLRGSPRSARERQKKCDQSCAEPNHAAVDSCFLAGAQGRLQLAEEPLRRSRGQNQKRRREARRARRAGRSTGQAAAQSAPRRRFRKCGSRKSAARNVQLRGDRLEKNAQRAGEGKGTGDVDENADRDDVPAVEKARLERRAIKILVT